MENYRFYKCIESLNVHICDQIDIWDLYITDITNPNIIVIDKMIPKKLDDLVIKYQLGFSIPVIVRKSK